MTTPTPTHPFFDFHNATDHFDFFNEFKELIRVHDEFSITDVVRSDTGFWYTGSHVPSAPLRFLNKKFLPFLKSVRVSDIMQAGQPRAQYTFTFSREISTDFEVVHAANESDSDTSSCAFFDLRDASRSLTDLVVEGTAVAVETALLTMRRLGCVVHRENKRKTAVGVQMRLSVCSQGLHVISQAGVVFGLPSNQYYFGITFYSEDGLQSELIELLAQSEYRGRVIHESPRWITLGCSDEIESSTIIHQLQQWRESGEISTDIHFRQWKCIESAKAEGGFTCATKFGIVSPKRDTVLADGVHGRLQRQDVSAFLDSLGIPGASFFFYEEDRSRKLRISGLDLSSLKGAKFKLAVAGGFTIPLFFADQPASPNTDAPPKEIDADMQEVQTDEEDVDVDTTIVDADHPHVTGPQHTWTQEDLGVGSIIEAKLHDATGGNEPFATLRVTNSVPGVSKYYEVIPLAIEQQTDAIVVPVRGPKNDHGTLVFTIEHQEAKNAGVHTCNSKRFKVQNSDEEYVRQLAEGEARDWARGIKEFLRKEATYALADPERTVHNPNSGRPKDFYDINTARPASPAATLAHSIIQTEKIGRIEALNRYQSAINAIHQRFQAKRSNSDHQEQKRARTNSPP